jgi:hypothetical protein
MRYLHYAFFAMLLLFAAVQYNDPDWYYWGPVYLVAAAWSYFAAREPGRFRTWPAAVYGAPISAVLLLVGFASLAHTIKSGWIHIEEAREAFGYLISAATTIFAIFDSRRRTEAGEATRS